MPFSFHHSFSSVATRLLIEKPFYGHLLSRLPRHFSDRTDSIALLPTAEGSWHLAIHPGFWQQQLDQQGEHKLGELIRHQLLHWVFGHPAKKGLYPGDSVFDLAIDLAVNQYLDYSAFVPQAAILEQLYQLFSETWAPAEYYYEALTHQLSNPIVQTILKLHEALHQQHEGWKEVIQQPLANQSIARRQLSRAIRAARSLTDGNTQEAASAQLYQRLAQTELFHQPGGLHWSQLLRRFAGRSRYLRSEHSLRRPSRRYGSFPGIQLKRSYKLWVALDVSGSISEEELQAFWQELRAIRKQGAELWVVAFDHRIQSVFEYKGQENVSISGGGGTNFQAPIDFINQHKRVDAVVFFTDGRAAMPVDLPKAPLLWLISANGTGPDQLLWKRFAGAMVKMEKEMPIGASQPAVWHNSSKTAKLWY